MKNVHYLTIPDLIPTVKSRLISPVKTVLDIGCGIRPQQYVTAKKHIFIEPWEEYTAILKTMVNKDDIILEGTWEEKIFEVPDNSVDTVFILDVIEHLEKRKGKRLLPMTVAKARKQVVILTPLGFQEQEHPDGIDAWGLHGGKWQEHKSGWAPDDFDDTWEGFVCRNFHHSDNMGRRYIEPKGIFFAIKTIK